MVGRTAKRWFKPTKQVYRRSGRDQKDREKEKVNEKKKKTGAKLEWGGVPVAVTQNYL